ncbi:hypothetical protein [Archangium sp.]|uniref:hypothetical protein n=1 Tax=Archangium sp. TaxID=1872627 RepID=UPI00286B78D4|nr:hypothetical protein [Archangium sp.]
MSARAHPIARWLRLMLACLALFAGSAPARAMSEVAAVVAVSVEQRAPERPLSTVASVRGAQGEEATAPVLVPVSFTVRVPEIHPPGPPRRLFLAHRSLLR